MLWNLSCSRKLEDGIGPATQMKTIIGGFGFLSDIQTAMRTHRSNVSLRVCPFPHSLFLTLSLSVCLSVCLSLSLSLSLSVSVSLSFGLSGLLVWT